MKKMILVLALLGFSAAAQAGTYMNAVDTLKMCDVAGNLAITENQLKKAGLPLSDALDYLKGRSADLTTVARKLYSGDFTDGDAHSMGWAACMDYYAD